MKIQIVSDLHLEFHREQWPSVIELIKPAPEDLVDVLVMAGDLTLIDGLEEALTTLCGIWPEVVYVTGNHEYYLSTREQVHALLERASQNLPNLHWLQDSCTEIQGKRFLGSTLWFQEQADNVLYENRMSDFRVIQGLRGWVYRSNTLSRKFLRDNVLEGDIVVTHHMPHPRSVAARFRGSSLNRFFLCDCQDILKGKKPAIWVHGHTHDCFDYRTRSTQIVANPYGYPHEPKTGFKPNLYVEIL